MFFGFSASVEANLRAHDGADEKGNCLRRSEPAMRVPSREQDIVRCGCWTKLVVVVVVVASLGVA